MHSGAGDTEVGAGAVEEEVEVWGRLKEAVSAVSKLIPVLGSLCEIHTQNGLALQCPLSRPFCKVFGSWGKCTCLGCKDASYCAVLLK